MIFALFKHLDKKFEILKVLKQKPTARCPFQYIVEFDNSKYLTVIAKTDVQKFYLKRSLEKQKDFFDDFKACYEFNFPIYTGDLNDFCYAIYPYIDNLKFSNDEKALKLLNEVYEKHSKDYIVNYELIERIKVDFISSWPQSFHKQIKNLPLYEEYFEKISKEKTLTIYKEHSDYTINNILTNKDKIYLMDFEFAKDFQVIGFDEYDYKMSFKRPENNTLHELRTALINNINKIIDSSIIPKIIKIKNKESFIEKVEPNFIYNRFDIRFGDNYELYKIEESSKEIFIPIHIRKKRAILGVWLSPISQLGFDELIKQVWQDYPKLKSIQTRYSLNPYDGLLVSNNWTVYFASNIEDFNKLLSHKTRYNTKWYPKKIKEDLGAYEIKKYSKENIPDEVVMKYFEFKRTTHDVNYNMTIKEYLDKFYVENAYVLIINNNIESVLFVTFETDIIYLENFAFNQLYAKYSLGMVLYYHLIQDLISRGKKLMYLGDGFQEYKKRFAGINQLAFDGVITRPQKKSFITRINLLAKIKKFIRKRKNFNLPKVRRPKEWQIMPTDKILILSPHPDDETIGCGGLLIKYAKQCDVVLLTNGCYGDPDIKPDEMTKIRSKEFQIVMKEMGVNSYKMLNIEDTHLLENKNTLNQIDFSGYNYVLMPGDRDAHPDHIAVSYLLKSKINKQNKQAKIVYYEIWSANAIPTHYIDISTVIMQKKFLINIYKSQTCHIDYASRILALNHYRGLLSRLDYVESYQMI